MDLPLKILIPTIALYESAEIKEPNTKPRTTSTIRRNKSGIN